MKRRKENYGVIQREGKDKRIRKKGSYTYSILTKWKHTCKTCHLQQILQVEPSVHQTMLNQNPSHQLNQLHPPPLKTNKDTCHFIDSNSELQLQTNDLGINMKYIHVYSCTIKEGSRMKRGTVCFYCYEFEI